MLVYQLATGFKPTLASHRNAKEKKHFYPMWPSIIGKIKECPQQGPKATVECLSTVVGGVVGASSPGQLHSDEQATNLRKKEKLRRRCFGASLDADDLFVVMQRTQSEDPATKFVRVIRATPDPSIGEGPQWLKLDVNQQQVHISLVWFATSVSLVYLDGCMGRWMVTK